MPAPSTIDEFLAVVHKSGVLPQERLVAYMDQLRSSGASLPAAPGGLADLLVRDGLLTQFQRQQLLLGKYLGFMIGNYKVLELVGCGGMSAVYLCEDKLWGRRVAIKVLPRPMAKDPTLLKRFYREAQACITLDHPNLARGYEVAQERDQHYFVMEYIQGISLQELVKKNGPMMIARACHYIRQAAVGLQYAHEKGL